MIRAWATADTDDAGVMWNFLLGPLGLYWYSHPDGSGFVQVFWRPHTDHVRLLAWRAWGIT